ncbi:unnamed protein product [Owenia fusiformis]|uniref:Uncharacterized protein n=1 Tax=Owenia fusiformis TaxID=6347 RepID=A0A8J1TU08_OWEFU|nr:unnamed protein product [Owenia fusiformis]
MATDCLRSYLRKGRWEYGKEYFRDGVLILPFVHPAAYSEETKNFKIRKDDVFMSSFPRAGTHLTCELIQSVLNFGSTRELWDQQIHDRLQFLQASKEVILGTAPSIEDPGSNPLPRAEAAQSPRLFFNHMSYEFVPNDVKRGKCKVIITHRNPKSTYLSWFYLFRDGFKGMFDWDSPLTWEDFSAAMLTGETKDMPGFCGTWFDFYKQWWENRTPNMFFLNYEALMKDAPKVIMELAKFLEKDLNEDQVETISQHIKFDNLKKSPGFGEAFARLEVLGKGAAPHMRKGKIDDWKNVFTVAQSEQFDKLFKEKMKDTCFPEPIYE